MTATLPARRRTTARPASAHSQPPQMLEPLESRLCLSASAAQVYPQGATVDGRSLGSWAEAWTKWAYETPTATSPLRDTTGQFAAANQPKGVFFLAGSDQPGTYDRTVTVKPGTKLFIPVLTTVWITLPTDEPITIAQIRDIIDGIQDGAQGAFLTIDGKAVKNVNDHREQDPNPKGFTLNMPADNVFGIPAGAYAKSAIDGIFVMAQPLTPGAHTVHFGGSFDGFALDVTYHVNVVPPGHADDPPAHVTFCSAPAKGPGKSDHDSPWDD